MQLPVAVAVLWEVFCGLAGADALRWAEIQAWANAHGVPLSAWELDTLVAMDRAMHARLQAQAQARAKATEKRTR